MNQIPLDSKDFQMIITFKKELWFLKSKCRYTDYSRVEKLRDAVTNEHQLALELATIMKTTPELLALIPLHVMEMIKRIDYS